MSDELTRPRHHRFLSPHYDDIALSCGGTAALLSRAGLTPEVAVLFGGEPAPDAQLTPFATFQHDRWGLEAAEVIGGRRREEAAAAAILGARVTLLPFLDAIYRGERYLNDDQLIGEPTADEADLPRQVIVALGLDGPPDRSIRVYAPLAVGGHVDHRHAFIAGVQLANEGWDCWFYEDLPYALSDGLIEERIGDAAVLLEPAAIIDVGPVWDVKIDAILAYVSQVRVVFRHLADGATRDAIDAALLSYAVHVGDGAPGERFWRPDLSSVPSVRTLPRTR